MLLPFVNPACPIKWSHRLTRGLVDRWRVIPNSGWRGGLTLRDLVRGGKNPHDGTLTNGATWEGSHGRLGGTGTLQFDGSDDFVDIVQADDTPYTGALTIIAWAFVRTGGTYRHFAGKHASNGAASNPFDFRTGANGTTLTLIRANDAGEPNTQCTGPSLTTGQWQLVGFSSPADPSSGIRFILNTEVSAASYSSNSATTVTGSGANIRLGRRADGVVQQDGFMDDIAIWSRQLSDAEMLQWYLATRQQFDPTLNWVEIATTNPSLAVLYEQEGYRWRDDDGSETTAAWLANQDTNISRGKNTNTRLRVLTNVTSDPPTKRVKAQYLSKLTGNWRDIKAPETSG